MINYADYAFYKDTYKGAVLDTASFDLYARKATQIIKLNTFNRVDDANIPEEVKICTCEIAELAYKLENAETGGNKVSEKVGSYSVEYKTAEQIKQEYDGKINASLWNWLGLTGLLYRGLC